jgi:hypothetical protein
MLPPHWPGLLRLAALHRPPPRPAGARTRRASRTCPCASRRSPARWRSARRSWSARSPTPRWAAGGGGRGGPGVRWGWCRRWWMYSSGCGRQCVVVVVVALSQRGSHWHPGPDWGASVGCDALAAACASLAAVYRALGPAGDPFLRRPLRSSSTRPRTTSGACTPSGRTCCSSGTRQWRRCAGGAPAFAAPDQPPAGRPAADGLHNHVWSGWRLQLCPARWHCAVRSSRTHAPLPLPPPGATRPSRWPASSLRCASRSCAA